MKVLNRGYHALLLILGGSRFFAYADAVFLYDALISRTIFSQGLAKIWWQVWGIFAILCVSSFLSPNSWDGYNTAGRVLLLSAVLPGYRYRKEYARMLSFGLVGLLALVSVQSTFDTRPVGIHFNASSLAVAMFGFAPLFLTEISLIAGAVIAFSLTRSPIVGLAFFSLVQFFIGRWRFMYLFIVTLTLFVVVNIMQGETRYTPEQFRSGTVAHIETTLGHSEQEIITKYTSGVCGEYRPVEWRLFGYGLYGFCESTGQPRPHNIYFLSWYEFGILAIPFWLLILSAAWRVGLVVTSPLFFIGLGTEELLGRPEGIYIIAAWLVSSYWLWRKPDPHPLNTWRNRASGKVEG